MKSKIILNAPIIYIIIVIILLGVFGYTASLYKMEVEVVSVEDNIATVCDERGLLWDIQADNLKEGEKYVATFHDNTTTGNIYDDKIIDIRG